MQGKYVQNLQVWHCYIFGMLQHLAILPNFTMLVLAAATDFVKCAVQILPYLAIVITRYIVQNVVFHIPDTDC